MARTREAPTAAEWTLLNAVWRLGKATVREIHDAVRGETGWAYTTVKTMLERMAAKGFLHVARVGPVKQFYARRRKSDVVPRAIEGFLDHVLGDSLAPLVGYIAKARGLDEKEIRELRRILEPEKEA